MTPNKFLPPSAWGQTPAQRLARLRLYVKLTEGRRGIAAKQRARHLEEIEEIEKGDHHERTQMPPL